MDLATILLVLANVGNFSMGLLVYLRNKKATANFLFGILAFVIVLWGIAMIIFRGYIFFGISDPLILSKILFSVASLPVFFLFLFAFIFPEESSRKPHWITISLAVIGLLTIIFAIMATDLIIRNVEMQITKNHRIIFGDWYFIYLFYVMVYIGAAIINMFLNTKKLFGIQKKQLFYFFIGVLISASISLFFNLILPIFKIYEYQWFGQVSTLIMLGFMTYAIMKLHLLRVKIVTAEFFTFIMWVFILIRFLTTTTNQERILNGGFLVFITVFGLLLIRSVIKEVRAREEIEELATKLEFANLRLKQLDEAKSDFLSIASHQLRTPLTAIKGYASMILEGSYGKISETTKSAVDKIFQSSQRLVLIIGDFLDISHIEQGTMQYDFAALDVKELAKGLTDEFKATIESSTDKSKALKISFEADEKENFSVNADRNKIRQVVSNLIDNSIKYTPAGFVKVSLSKIAENGNVLLKIEDSGIGISAETMPNLFKKFGRAKSLSSAFANGSGLGLYVAKEIIKAHKGKIWAESEGEGKGSKFFVELPEK